MKPYADSRLSYGLLSPIELQYLWDQRFYQFYNPDQINTTEKIAAIANDNFAWVFQKCFAEQFILIVHMKLTPNLMCTKNLSDAIGLLKMLDAVS